MFGHDNNQDLHQDDTPQTDSVVSAPPTIDDQNVSSAPPVIDTNSPPPDEVASFNNQSPTSDVSTVAPTATPTTPNVEDLLSIKQGALQALSPLVSHLDQTPEEKFKTTMMMIQASDDQGLVKEAYETAQKITDEKARAQALLDVVNEINYFTQHSK
ncbi:MAG: hypothetical protein AAB459_01055 [Patescibacteria group bacterium]